MKMKPDITEQTHAAETLRASERRLMAVIEGTNIGTWEWNVQSGETVFNERWAEIVGFRLEELEPISIQTWLRLAHPEDLRRAGEQLERHFSGELPFYDVECRMRHKEGYWVWVHDRGRVVSRTADGKPLLMYGTHADISEQKRAEASLRASEAQYRSLIVNMPGAAYQCLPDAYWTMLYMSEAVEALTGYPAFELIGNAARSYASLIHPDDAGRVRRAVEKAVDERQAWAIEYRLHDRDGELRWVYERGQAVREDDGSVLYLSGFILDISDRKLAERNLEESALHTRTILDNVVDGIVTVDAFGTVNSFNRSAEDIFGYP
ncbi:MAG: PAS domain-containing protein, partial [Thiohalobacteraceae bacterium]